MVVKESQSERRVRMVMQVFKKENDLALCIGTISILLDRGGI